jgi:hypothetical protein
VKLQTALPELIGDLKRFGVLADRIEGFAETQGVKYRPGTSDWVVLPWAEDFTSSARTVRGNGADARLWWRFSVQT